MSFAKKTIMGIALAAIAYSLAYAQNPELQRLEQNGFKVAQDLKQLISNQEADRCFGDIFAAASYIELAAKELSLSKRTAALTSLAYGQNELKEISKNRAYCTHLATRIQPYVEQVSSIKRELEREPFPEEDIPDSCIKK